MKGILNRSDGLSFAADDHHGGVLWKTVRFGGMTAGFLLFSLIGLELGKGCARGTQHRHVAVVEVDDRAVEAVGPERTGRTAFGPLRTEHEMVDDELRASTEQVAQRLLSFAGVEDVCLVDRHPW